MDGPLFLRNHGPIKLTALGEDFLQYAQTIMASVDSAKEFIAETRSQAKRTIRFGAIPTIAPYLAPEIFASIQAVQPEIRIELVEHRTENLVEALTTGAIDLALLSPPTPVDPLCDHLTIRRDEMLLTLPSDHPLAKAGRLTTTRLSREPIILLEESHCLSRQVKELCERAGLTPDVSIRGAQLETLLRMVELGFGLTFTPEIAVSHNQHRNLVFRSLTRTRCHREIRLVWLRQPVLTRSLKLTLELLKSFDLSQ